MHIKVLPVNARLDSMDDPGLDLIYVGETILLCLVISAEESLLDEYESTLSVMLDKFAVIESRRLYSDSTENVNRMRSVDSLISDEHIGIASTESSVSTTTSNNSWTVHRIEPHCLVFCLIFTPQPISDDACNVRCNFIVSVRQIKTEQPSKNDEAIDPYVEEYLSKIFGQGPRSRIICTNLGNAERQVTLSSPLRITKEVIPLTSTQCNIKVEMESLDDDLAILDVSISTFKSSCAIQTGKRASSEEVFKVKRMNRNLPIIVGSFGEIIEFIVEKAQVDLENAIYKTKLDITLSPCEERRCLLSFESPFDPERAFLPVESDDFTISFSCEEDTIKLGDTFRVNIRINNRTTRPFELSLLFPLCPKETEKPNFNLTDAICPTAEQLVALYCYRISQFPSFVCMEAERKIGRVDRKSVYECSVQFMAVRPGKHSIHMVQLVEYNAGQPCKTIDFPNILHLNVMQQ
jgi:hypothetical protein